MTKNKGKRQLIPFHYLPVLKIKRPITNISFLAQSIYIYIYISVVGVKIRAFTTYK